LVLGESREHEKRCVKLTCIDILETKKKKKKFLGKVRIMQTKRIQSPEVKKRGEKEGGEGKEEKNN